MQKSEVADNQQVTEAELGWLAGMIDGEGCLFIGRHEYKKTLIYEPDVQIGNTDSKMIEALDKILTKIQVGHHIETIPAKANRRPNWRVRIGGVKRIERLLGIIKPYLFGKVNQADVLLKFCQSRLKSAEVTGEDTVKLNRNAYTPSELAAYDELKRLKEPQRLYVQAQLRKI